MVNANLIVQHVIQIKNRTMLNVIVSVKSIACANVEVRRKNSRYLKSIVDDSAIVCDEIISVTDSASTSVTNTISTNVTSTKSINSDDEKVDVKWIVIFCLRFYSWPYYYLWSPLFAIIMQNIGQNKKHRPINNLKISP